MSGIYTVSRVPVKVVSVNASNLDVDIVSNKNLIVIGGSKTAGHLVVDTGTLATSTRIMYGDVVAKLVKQNGSEVQLWGAAVNRLALIAGSDGVGVLINLNAYSIRDWASDNTKSQLVFSAANASYPGYDIAAIYKWNAAQEAFVWERNADPALDAGPFFNSWLFSHGPLPLLDGLLIHLESRSVDVDEDGPHMQVGVPAVQGFKAYTQYSIYRETITTSYTAAMVESEDCSSVPIQLGGGKVSDTKYRQLTEAQGLEYVARMRSIRNPERGYAPDGVCSSAAQNELVLSIDGDGKVAAALRPITGKESNYSLTNLVKRYDFWPDYIDAFGAEIELSFPCGGYADILQQGYPIGQVPTSPVDPAKWSGMRTISVPRIKSFTPRFKHVQFDNNEHVLSWTEEVVRSYILFNNFEQDGVAMGMQAFGAGGVFGYGSSFDDEAQPEIN